MFYQIIIVFHVLIGLGIIGLILIQQGKGADAGATFGSGASGSVFGASGSASFLTKATATLGALFFVTSLGLAVINSKQSTPVDDLMSAPAVDKKMDIPEAKSEAKSEIAPTPSVPDAKPTATEPASAAGQPEIQPPAKPEAVEKPTQPDETNSEKPNSAAKEKKK